jgi:hypothetical protein
MRPRNLPPKYGPLVAGGESALWPEWMTAAPVAYQGVIGRLVLSVSFWNCGLVAGVVCVAKSIVSSCCACATRTAE